MSARPLQAGDVCEVVGGLGRRASPNLGLHVTIKHRVYGAHGADHSEHGAIYHCEGKGVTQLTDAGTYTETGWADFAAAWLRRIEPPPVDQPDRIEREVAA